MSGRYSRRLHHLLGSAALAVAALIGAAPVSHAQEEQQVDFLFGNLDLGSSDITLPHGLVEQLLQEKSGSPTIVIGFFRLEPLAAVGD